MDPVIDLFFLKIFTIMMLGLAYGAAVILTGALVMLLKRATSKPSGRKRRMSFGSKALANGVFPDAAEAWKTIINAAFYFDNCPTIENVAKTCRALLFYDRFRSTIHKSSEGCFFEDITDSIDVERDLIRTIEVESEDAMAEKIDELCSITYPEGATVPLFIMYRLNNTGKGKSAVLVRLHHAIGDGVALIGSMSRVFQDLDGNPFSLDIPEKMGGGTNRSFSLATLWKFVTSTVAVIALPLTPFDSPIVFTDPAKKTNLTMKDRRRRTVYFPVLSLDFVKQLKNKGNVTVNDVLLACTAGAIRRYCAMKHDPLFVANAAGAGAGAVRKKPLLCRALMPVAFPRSSKELNNPGKAMRNYFAMISVPLPMDEDSSKGRLESCAETTRQLKSSPLALIQLVQNYVYIRTVMYSIIMWKATILSCSIILV